jgi:lysophospholipase L1-like esterase
MPKKQFKRKLRLKEGFWVSVIAVAIIFLYLNRSYAYFFDYMGSHMIYPPQTIYPQIMYLPARHDLETKPKFSQTANYFALGDSLTRGVGVQDPTQTYPYLVAYHMAQKRNVSFENLGISGAKAIDVLIAEVPKVKGVHQTPSYFTILIGINDVLGLTSESDFQRNYSQILSNLSSAPESWIYVINIPYLISSNMKPPYNYLVDWRTKRFNSIIRQVEQEQNHGNMYYIDLYSQTKEPFSTNYGYFSGDGFHPNADGYELWSNVINANLNI